MVNGKLASMLVDNGGQATVCSRKFDSQYDCAIGPSASNLHTAVGTPLEVLGETDIIFKNAWRVAMHPSRPVHLPVSSALSTQQDQLRLSRNQQ